jgi:hypothetical protein
MRPAAIALRLHHFMARHWEWCAVGAASLALAFVAFGVPPLASEGVDFFRLHELNKAYLGQSLRAGRLPLWNPYVGLGRPFAADIETGVFYPPNLVFLALPPDAGFAVLSVLHSILAGAGMLLFARAIGSRRSWPLLAALGFMFGEPIVGRMQTGSLPFTQALSYVPLLFCLGRELQDRPSRRGLAWVALAFSLQILAGHPQMWWLTIVGLTLFMGGRRFEAPVASNLGRLAVDVGRLAVAVAWACGLAGIQLLPFFELVGQGNRSGHSLELAAAYCLHWRALWSVLLPGNLVAPQGEDLCYCGALIGLAGLSGLLRFGDRELRGLLFLALGALCLGVGEGNVLFPLAVRVVPGMAWFRLHVRFAILLAFATTAAAARFLSDPLPTALWRRVAPSALLAAAAGVAAVGHLSADAAAPMGLWVVARYLLILLTSLLAIVAVLHPRRLADRHPAGAAACLLLLGAMDLGLSITHLKQSHVSPHVAAAERTVSADVLRYPRNPAEDGAPPRISVPAAYVRENAGLIYGWSTYKGYVALSLERVWTYLHVVLGIPVPRVLNTISAHEIDGFGPFPYRSMSLVLGFAPAERRLLWDSEPDPRVYLATQWLGVPNWRDALDLLRRGHDFHRRPLVETDRELPLAGADEAGGGGRARIRRFAPEAIDLELENAGAGWLVIAEAWYPGWSADVDGRSVPCVPANVWMRAVPVPAGAHEVKLRYHSTDLLAGAFVSAFSLLLCGLVLRPRTVAARPPAAEAAA